MLRKRHATDATEIVAICARYDIVLIDVCSGREVARVSCPSKYEGRFAINTALWRPGFQSVLRVFLTAPYFLLGELLVLDYDFNSDSYRKPIEVSNTVEAHQKIYKNVEYSSAAAYYMAATEILHGQGYTTVESAEVREFKCQRILQAHPSSNRVVLASWSETRDDYLRDADLLVAEWVPVDHDAGNLVNRRTIVIADFVHFYEKCENGMLCEPAHDYSSNICTGALPDLTEIMVVCRGNLIDIYDLSTRVVIQEIDVGNCCLTGVDVSADASMFTVRYRTLDDHEDKNFERHKLYKRVQE
jgi:hypothetical protein